jgi:hypothetical protein
MLWRRIQSAMHKAAVNELSIATSHYPQCFYYVGVQQLTARIRWSEPVGEGPSRAPTIHPFTCHLGGHSQFLAAALCGLLILHVTYQ